MTEKIHVERNVIAPGNQYKFIAYRDCLVDLMITAPNSQIHDAKTVTVSIDGMMFEAALVNGSMYFLQNIRLQHLNEVTITHGPLNAGRPFIVRLTEVPL